MGMRRINNTPWLREWAKGYKSDSVGKCLVDGSKSKCTQDIIKKLGYAHALYSLKDEIFCNVDLAS